MKHIELIELIYKHRHLIDEAFRGDEIRELPSELVGEAAIFQKVAKKYELSDSYIQFANGMLKRADANYTFGDYNEEIKLLMRQKADYLESGDSNLLFRMKELVRTLYKKIEQRDILINARINDIVNDNELSIERIIKDAKDVDARMTDLIDAHAKNLEVLGDELRGIDEGLDSMLIDIGLDLLPLTENIHAYNKRLSDFVLRTERRKEQNRKLASLARKIIKEQDHELKSLLLSNPELYHHTFKEKKTGRVKHMPAPLELKRGTFLSALSKILNFKRVEKKANPKKPYAPSVALTLKAVRLDAVQKDIARDKPADIYNYILVHPEIEKFKVDGLHRSYAFKTYLTVVQDNRVHVVLEKNFNENKVRIAKWI